MLRSVSVATVVLVAAMGVAEAKGGRGAGIGVGAGVGASRANRAAAQPAKPGEASAPLQSDGRFGRQPGEPAQPAANVVTADGSKSKSWCQSNVTAGGFCVVN